MTVVHIEDETVDYRKCVIQYLDRWDWQGWLQGGGWGGCIPPTSRIIYAFYIVDLYDACHFAHTNTTFH